MPSTRRKHWPPRWTQDRGVIYYRTRPAERHLWEGRSFFPLGRTEPEAWRTWYARTADTPSGGLETLGDAIDRYAREVLPDRAESTQRDYRRALQLLRNVFGHMRPSDLAPRHVYAYMDRRPGVAGNRERAVLSSVLSYAVRWGMLDRNPVREVRRSPERPRDRYVTDDEVAAFLEHAPPMIRAYVRLKLLTGLRQGQLLGLRRVDWDAERAELTAPATKGGRATVYQGPELRDAVAAIREACANGSAVASVWLIPSRTGRRYTSDGFRSIWQRAMRRYCDAGGVRFSEHDLRAKVASDAEAAHAQALMGHRSQITERVYRRKPNRVAVLRAPHDDE